MAQPEGPEGEKSAPGRRDKEPEQPNPAVQLEPLVWMKDCLAWGTRAQPGKHVMTMRAINIGLYGEVPEESRDMSRRPREPSPSPACPPPGCSTPAGITRRSGGGRWPTAADLRVRRGLCSKLDRQTSLSTLHGG